MLKNRTLLGLVSILVALVFCFGVAPLVSKKVSENEEVFVLSKTLERGGVLTEDKITTIKVESRYVPSNVIKDKEDVLGKVAVEPSYEGDFLLRDRFSEEMGQLDDIYRALGVDEYAVSISVKGLEGSVSGTLLPGDIVSVFSDSGILEAMRYVEVLAIADNTGKKDEDDESKKIDYVVLKLSEDQISYVTDEQYVLGLKYRGSQKQVFLDAQKKILAGEHTGDIDVEAGEQTPDIDTETLGQEQEPAGTEAEGLDE